MSRTTEKRLIDIETKLNLIVKMIGFSASLKGYIKEGISQESKQTMREISKVVRLVNDIDDENEKNKAKS